MRFSLKTILVLSGAAALVLAACGTGFQPVQPAATDPGTGQNGSAESTSGESAKSTNEVRSICGFQPLLDRTSRSR